MDTTSSVPEGPQELIRLHERASRRNRNAKRLLTLLLLAIVLGNVGYAYFTVKNTVENRTDELSKALGAEAESIAPDLAKAGSASLGRLSDRYADVMAKTFERDRDLYAKRLIDEVESLRLHAEGVQPKLHAELEKMVTRLEHDLRGGLAKHGIPEDKLTAAGEAYTKALDAKVVDFLEGPVSRYRTHVDSIAEKLDRLAATEPPGPSEDPMFLMGMALEWVGRDMQNNLVAPKPASEKTAAVKPVQ